MSIAAIMFGVVGIFLAGLITGAQMAIVAADHEAIRSRKRDGKGWASRALHWVEQPDRLFSTARLGIELSLLGSGTLVLTWAWDAWGWDWALALLAVFIPAFLLLGEILPHAFVAKRPMRWVPLLSWVLTLVHWVFWPWFVFQRAVMFLGLGGKNGEDPGEVPLMTRQELTWIIRGQEESSGLLQEEREMIDRIFHFSKTQVREVMIPLIEVSAIEETATVGEVIQRVDREGYSRFPVYRERIDRIVGIIHSFDFLEISSMDEPVAPFIRRAPFVPESMPGDELMIQLQREGNHMAIVMDEYGGSVGIVTLEDLLEEIVGEIQDEHDIQRVLFRRLSTHQYLVSARMEVDEVNELLGLAIPKEDYETLGGFLLKSFRKIPREGESMSFDGVRFMVKKADERSLYEILITLPTRYDKNGLRRP